MDNLIALNDKGNELMNESMALDWFIKQTLQKIEEIDIRLEATRYIFESSFDDPDKINRLYLEAEEKANVEKEGFLASIFRKLREFFNRLFSKTKDEASSLDLDPDEKYPTAYDEQTWREYGKNMDIQKDLLDRLKAATDSNNVQEMGKILSEIDKHYSEKSLFGKLMDKMNKAAEATGLKAALDKAAEALSTGAKVAAPTAGAVAIFYVSGALLTDVILKSAAVAGAAALVSHVLGDRIGKIKNATVDNGTSMGEETLKEASSILNKVNRFRIKTYAKVIGFGPGGSQRRMDYLKKHADAEVQKETEEAEAKKILEDKDKVIQAIREGKLKGKNIANYLPQSMTFKEFIKQAGNLEQFVNTLKDDYKKTRLPKFTDGDTWTNCIPKNKAEAERLADLSARKEYAGMTPFFDLHGIFSGHQIGSLAWLTYCGKQKLLKAVWEKAVKKHTGTVPSYEFNAAVKAIEAGKGIAIRTTEGTTFTDSDAERPINRSGNDPEPNGSTGTKGGGASTTSEDNKGDESGKPNEGVGKSGITTAVDSEDAEERNVLKLVIENDGASDFGKIGRKYSKEHYDRDSNVKREVDGFISKYENCGVALKHVLAPVDPNIKCTEIQDAFIKYCRDTKNLLELKQGNNDDRMKATKELLGGTGARSEIGINGNPYRWTKQAWDKLDDPIRKIVGDTLGGLIKVVTVDTGILGGGRGTTVK